MKTRSPIPVTAPRAVQHKSVTSESSSGSTATRTQPLGSKQRSISWDAYSLWNRGHNTLEIAEQLSASRGKKIDEAVIRKHISKALNEIYEGGFKTVP